ncbi:class I SAM-dependent methyltransferase [Nocardioides marinquilinus]|uniref:Class I SAM-dependent methyltransferase n=1 Tax=Nocardioides marinquilinus TaxID=1210400 RepID=A0ABP9PPL9_9ACTN
MAADDFPTGFFDRQDERDDADFYGPPRLVTHIDDGAIAAVTALYDELGVPEGRVLDLMSSWVSHLSRRPDGGLVALGMNAAELAANPMAEATVVQDLNRDPRLPFEDAAFDAVTCCVSIDYLVRPVEVLREVERVLRPGGVVVLTFSNRCFPTKAIRAWLFTDEEGRVTIVRAYLERAGFADVSTALRTDPGAAGDPLYAAWGRVGRADRSR